MTSLLYFLSLVGCITAENLAAAQHNVPLVIAIPSLMLYTIVLRSL